VTVPAPLPFTPALSVSHAALLVAVHPQPVPAETVTVPAAAEGEVRFADDGEMVNVQGRPACVTVNVAPPIVIVPVRGVAAVFAATM